MNRIWPFISDGRKRCRWDHSSRIYYNTQKKEKKNSTKNQMFFSEYKKTKKNKKKTRTYLRLEIVSSIFTRYATLYRGGA